MDRKSDRIEWVDCAKGIGIILVVAGHSICPRELKYWLYTFHMPLFFFLSGLTFNYKKYNTFIVFIKSKIRTLIIPYIVLSVICFLWKLVNYIVLGTKMDILSTLLGFIIQIRGGRFGAGIWFLPLIFVTELLIWCILRLGNERKKRVVTIALVMLVIGYLYCRFVDVKLPWAVDSALVSTFFMTIGFYSKSILNHKIGKLGLLFVIPNITVGFLNSYMFDTRVDMWSNDYGSLVLYLISAFSGIYFCITLSTIVKPNWLNYIGRYSLYFYGLHLMIVEVMTKVMNRVIDTSKVIDQYIAMFVTVLSVLLILNVLPKKMDGFIKKYSDRIKILK